MTVHVKECWVETKGKKRSNSGPRAAMVAMVFLWILLILAQVCFFFAVFHQETGEIVKSSVPRKARFLDKQWFQFHAPPRSQSQPVDAEAREGGDPDKLYGDDERIIHTGPNPLHN